MARDGLAVRHTVVSAPIVDLTARGAFDQTTNDWNLAQELGTLIAAHPDLRSHVNRLLKDSPIIPGLEMLARAIAEYPDEDGLLLLARFEKELKRTFVTHRTIDRLVTEDVPIDDWAGVYNVVPALSAACAKSCFL